MTQLIENLLDFASKILNKILKNNSKSIKNHIKNLVNLKEKCFPS
jgi:hypothetical protein